MLIPIENDFNDGDIACLKRLFSEASIKYDIALDPMAHHESFDAIHRTFVVLRGKFVSKDAMWNQLIDLRKAGQLPGIRQLRKADETNPT